MRTREQQIDMEAAALWRCLHSQPPPDGLSGAALIEAALRTLPDRDYDRMSSPYLRPSQIARPTSTPDVRQ